VNVGIVATVASALGVYLWFMWADALATSWRGREPVPWWVRRIGPLGIAAFAIVAIVVATTAPAWFGGLILGACIGMTVGFQARRSRRRRPQG
jgi:peptidoglycan/LPS O-acetylase OafA/YrhL